MSQLFDEATQFTDEDTNTLLVGGLLYIGDPGVDAKLNEKDVFDNRELTGAPLGQPLVLGADGRVAVKAWVSGTYSFKVENSAGSQKYNELQNGFAEAVGNVQTTGSLGVNDIVATGVPTQTAYVDNQQYIVTAPADNTGAMTIKIDTLAVIDIRKAHDQAIVSGDVKQDMKLVLVYNGTDNWMELQSAVLGSVFGGSIQVGGDILDGNGNEIIGLTEVASAVNEIDIQNAITGTGPTIGVTGNNANIDQNHTVKGSGDYNVTTTTGDINLVSSSGNVVAAGRNIATDGAKLDGLGVQSEVLNTKVIDIGDWNMNSTTTIVVPHGLTLAKIRPPMAVLIRNDPDTAYSSLEARGAAVAGWLEANATNVILNRIVGQSYDSTAYDSTSYNRGWITIRYTD
jgi:hypothetical protein